MAHISLTMEQFRRKTIRRNVAVSVVITLLLAISFVISMNTGFSRLTPLDTIRTLFGGGNEKENMVLFQFRLPRIVLSLLVGAGLGVAGSIIQGVARNPLADLCGGQPLHLVERSCPAGRGECFPAEAPGTDGWAEGMGRVGVWGEGGV